jgi:hypothetical protein
MTAQAVCLCQMKYTRINMTHRVLTKRKEYDMNRYMVELKKDLKSEKSFRIYIRAYSTAQVVEMFNDEYFITELELRHE